MKVAGRHGNIFTTIRISSKQHIKVWNNVYVAKIESRNFHTWLLSNRAANHLSSAPGPQEMTSFYFIIHNFGILLRRHILTIFVSICDPAYVMINDVTMSRMWTLCGPWSCLFLCSCSRVVDIWHLMCGWWSMSMGKYSYKTQNNLPFPFIYVTETFSVSQKLNLGLPGSVDKIKRNKQKI